MIDTSAPKFIDVLMKLSVTLFHGSLPGRECDPEHKELIIIVESRIVRLPQRDSIGCHEVIVGLYERVSLHNTTR